MDSRTVRKFVKFKETRRIMAEDSPPGMSAAHHHQCPTHCLDQNLDLNNEGDKIRNIELEGLHGYAKSLLET